MSIDRNTQQGFSLIELAVVIIVVGLLLTGLLLPLATQVEISRVEETKRQLAQIREALLGFAMVNGRLPCPATPDTRGHEAPWTPTATNEAGEKWCARTPGADGNWNTPDDVTFQHGFVPAVTLGIPGPVNNDELLVDAWGNPFRYSVSRRDLTEGPAATPLDLDDDEWDFVVTGEMRQEGPAVFQGSADLLVVCNNSPNETNGAINDTACDDTVTPPSIPVTEVAPAVFFSMGPDGAALRDTNSLHQLENAGERKPPSLERFPPANQYPISADGDLVFVSRERRGQVDDASYFDDLVEWISPTVLYYKLVSAGHLP